MIVCRYSHMLNAQRTFPHSFLPEAFFVGLPFQDGRICNQSSLASSRLSLEAISRLSLALNYPVLSLSLSSNYLSLSSNSLEATRSRAATVRLNHYEF